jgi:hypothetical protein
MLQLMRLVAIGSVLMFVPGRSPLAQQSYPFSHEQLPTLFSLSLIDEITEAPTRVVVRGTPRADKGKRVKAGWMVICERTQGRDVLLIQDRELKTDDRWGLESGACDALLAAARKRKEAQGP